MSPKPHDQKYCNLIGAATYIQCSTTSLVLRVDQTQFLLTWGWPRPSWDVDMLDITFFVIIIQNSRQPLCVLSHSVIGNSCIMWVHFHGTTNNHFNFDQVDICRDNAMSVVYIFYEVTKSLEFSCLKSISICFGRTDEQNRLFKPALYIHAWANKT